MCERVSVCVGVCMCVTVVIPKGKKNLDLYHHPLIDIVSRFLFIIVMLLALCVTFLKLVIAQYLLHAHNRIAIQLHYYNKE